MNADRLAYLVVFGVPLLCITWALLSQRRQCRETQRRLREQVATGPWKAINGRIADAVRNSGVNLSDFDDPNRIPAPFHIPCPTCHGVSFNCSYKNCSCMGKGTILVRKLTAKEEREYFDKIHNIRAVPAREWSKEYPDPGQD